MRTVAIIANLALLGLIGVLLAQGEIEVEAEQMPVFLLMIAAPVLSILALLLRGVASKDWLSKYFERRALVERRKLEALRLQGNRPTAGAAAGAVQADQANDAEGPSSAS